MKILEFKHNTRDKVTIRTENHNYSVLLGRSMKGIMTGVYWLYMTDSETNPHCVYRGEIDPSLFIPTDEKAINLIEEQVRIVIEKYES